jgi:regulator of protease activity HflC (stomatin/prohibitin superfamily)
MIRKIKIRSFEVGLHFRDGEFQSLMQPGNRWLFDPLLRHDINIVSQRDPWINHPQLDMIVRSDALADLATVLDLKDNQRAIVWIDGRFARVLKPSLYAYWNGFRDIRVEIVDASNVRFDHADLRAIVRSNDAAELLDVCDVDRHCSGVLFIDGKFVETLAPGKYAFWKGASTAKVVQSDLRETVIDVSGQEVMTADKVSLRLNALVTYRVVDAVKSVSASDNVHQTLYRESQLAVRAVVGSRDLDAFLADKDVVASEIEQMIRVRANELGLELASVGIRDVILPGEMRDLMNKVTEARKAAEANLIVRREETAAMRSQANTAKVLGDNPTLMRMRELEVLERIAAAGKLNVVLGEKGLTDKITNLL